MLKKISADYKDTAIYSLAAVLIGILVGALDFIFGAGLIHITEFRDRNVFKLLPFLPIAGLFITFLYTRYGKNSIKGMSLIFQAGFKKEEKIPKRLVPFIILSTWLTHLFGGSAGREGVAMQIGGAVSHTIGNIKNKQMSEDSHKIWIVIGMAAGFAGLFQTPLAAVFFAMEVMVVGTLEYKALIPCIIAAFTASFTSNRLGLEKFSMALGVNLNLSPALIGKLVLLGVFFGITGGLFAYLLSEAKKILPKFIKNPYLKIFAMGCFLSILFMLLYQGRYSGLGTNLIKDSLQGGDIHSYDWLIKMLLTILTLAAGFQGGEVTPLFAIGASLGVVLGGVLGIPAAFAAALGYISVFGSATKTMLAPMFIGAEIFGYEYLPYFFFVTAISYMFNGNKTIYTAQKINI